MARQAKYLPQIRIILLLFGPLMILGGGYAGHKTFVLLHDGIRTPGTVVSLESRWSNNGNHGSYTYYPVVNFTTRDGQINRFTDNTGANPPMYQAGNQVTVIYLADNPAKSAIIDHGLGNWIMPGVLILLGGVSWFAGTRIRSRPG